jgi:hypothetical protein
MEISNSPQTAPVNTLATFNGTLTGTSCYIYPVNLSCGSGAPPTCRVAPAVPAPTVSGAPFTVTVSSDVTQIYNFNHRRKDGSEHGYSLVPDKLYLDRRLRHAAVQLHCHAIVEHPVVASGQPAIYTLDVVPAGGAFPNNATLAYSANCRR